MERLMRRIKSRGYAYLPQWDCTMSPDKARRFIASGCVTVIDEYYIYTNISLN